MAPLESLTLADLNLIKESLQHTKLNVEANMGYPSNGFKRESIRKLSDLLQKISGIIELKKQGNSA
jgi:hypothetical protein